MVKGLKSNNVEINPWVALFTKPRQTIQAITTYNSNYHLIFLCAVYGLGSLLLGITMTYPNMRLFSIFAWSIVLSPILGYIIFTLFSWFVWLTGKWLGGKSSFKEIRAAAVWSHYPLGVVNSVYAAIFISLVKTSESFNLSGPLFMVFALILLVLVAWTFVIFIGMLAEVQKFSVWKSLFNIILCIALIAMVNLTVNYFLIFNRS